MRLVALLLLLSSGCGLFMDGPPGHYKSAKPAPKDGGQ